MRIGKAGPLYILALVVPALAAGLAGGIRKALVALVLTTAGGLPGIIYALFVVRDAQVGTDRAMRQTLRMLVILVSTCGVAVVAFLAIGALADLLHVNGELTWIVLPLVVSIGGGVARAVDEAAFGER